MQTLHDSNVLLDWIGLGEFDAEMCKAICNLFQKIPRGTDWVQK